MISLPTDLSFSLSHGVLISITADRLCNSLLTVNLWEG